MSSLDPPVPARMSRVAIVAPEPSLRDALAAVADAGVVQLVGTLPAPEGEELEALRRLERAAAENDRAGPRLAPQAVDPGELERLGRHDLLAGEVELVRRADAAVRHGRFAALVGWAPQSELAGLEGRLAAVRRGPRRAAAPGLGRAADAAPRAPGRPLLPAARGHLRRAPLRGRRPDAVRRLLVRPHVRDDVRRRRARASARRPRRGALAGTARALRSVPPASGRSRSPRASRRRSSACSTGSSSARPESSRPSGSSPPRIRSSCSPPRSPSARVLLAVSYGIGIVNRWREGGPAAALTAPSGIAGFLVFLGLGVAAWGWYVDSAALGVVGGVLALAGRAPPGSRLPCRGRPRGGGGDPGDDRGLRLGHPRRRERHLVHAPRGLRAHARRARREVVWDATTALWGGAVGVGARRRRVRRRQCADVRARGPGRGRPGAPARVLRALLAHLRGRGAAASRPGSIPLDTRMEAAWTP